MSSQRSRLLIVLLGSLALLSSCLGLKADVAIRADGSGTIALDYRLSKMVESLGKLDGNERWLPFPIGQADFERSVEKVPGLSLTSFNQSSDDTDILVRANLTFSDAAALLGFLDATGRNVSLAVKDKTVALTLQMSEGGALDADLEELVRSVFAGYDVSLRLTTPNPPQAAGATITDRTATFSLPTADLLSARTPLIWLIQWKE